jgi:endonuclease YncB( thermonuclease family)
MPSGEIGLRSAVVALALIALTSPVVAQSLSGQADVVDVDTIAIRGERTRIRLYGKFIS